MKISINDINESLCSLDTEYRESLAHALVDLKYLSDTPLALSYGTEKQQAELFKVENMPLKANQIKKIMSYMLNDMKGDFQYSSFQNIASHYLNKAEQMKSKNG